VPRTTIGPLGGSKVAPGIRGPDRGLGPHDALTIDQASGNVGRARPGAAKKGPFVSAFVSMPRVVLILLANAFAMPVYWYVHVWSPSRTSSGATVSDTPLAV